MTIGILNLIGLCVLFAIGGAFAAYFILKNNPGLVDRWSKDVITKKNRALAEAQKMIQDLEKRVGLK